MRVLLIYPPSPDTFWSFKHVLRFVSKRTALPPLGLLTLVAMLPAEWQLRLVDLNAGPLKDDDLRWPICGALCQRTDCETCRTG